MATPDATGSAFWQAFHATRATATPRTPRTPLTVRAAHALARTLPRWTTIRTAALSTAGFGLLTGAAWTLHTAAGLAVGGASLLVLEALSGGERR